MTAPGVQPRLKVCCIATVREAEIAVNHGANAIGLVSEMPSGPGVIPDDRIEEIAARIPPGVSTFLLTSSRHVAAIVDQQRRLGVDVCTGLRTRGASDAEKLARFTRNLEAESE